MRAVVLEQPNELTMVQADVPTPGPGDVLVEVQAVGVCGSDVHCYRHGNIGSLVMDSPIILGHEAAGVVVDVGQDVPLSRLGQRVALEPGRPCLSCIDCLRGHYNLCRQMEFFAAPPTDGAFREYVTLPSIFAHEIPDGISIEAAALLEPVSCAIHSTRQARIGLGSRVLISGAGPIGLLLVQLSRALGAATITVTDPHRERLSTAERFGATRALLSSEPISGLHDAFIDASGASSAIHSGIMALDRLGVAVLVGIGELDVAVPVEHILSNEIILTGSFRYRDTWPLAIELVSSGKVDVDSFVTARFGLDEIEQALSTTKAPGNIKSVVYPNVRSMRHHKANTTTS
jgi:L-iditol 2-dehydrogenase